MAEDGSWSLDVRAAISSVIPEGTDVLHVDAAVQQAISTVLETIVHSWPVDTGRSLAGFARTDDGIDNPVEYTAFVLNGLVESLAAEGLDRARREIAETLAEVARRATGPRNQVYEARGKVADVLRPSRRRPADLLAAGRTMEAVAAFRATTAAAQAVALVAQLDLSPGLASAARSLASAGRLTEAVALLRRAGRPSQASQLAALARES